LGVPIFCGNKSPAPTCPRTRTNEVLVRPPDLLTGSCSPGETIIETQSISQGKLYSSHVHRTQTSISISILTGLQTPTPHTHTHTMFGVFIPSRPVIPEMSTISPTQFAISFPASPQFHNVGVFMHPNQELPPGTAAGVYMQLPGEQGFKFFGAIGNEKPSALFRVNIPEAMLAPGQQVNLGLSVEPVQNIQAQMAQLQQDSSSSSSSGAMVVAKRPPDTRVLAQRIIKNAFNFLASFAGNTANGIEVVPLKSFQDWWSKFERKVQNDPGFLERDEV